VVLSFGCELALEEFWRKSFDLISSDWHMPKMAGLNFFKTLSKNHKWNEILFLLVIAEKERDKVLDALLVGIKKYLVKSVEPEKLSNKIIQLAFGGVA
jgi:two-component system, chemotaxis family, chemotaxis protein CheY